jgi:hypothetical protein
MLPFSAHLAAVDSEPGVIGHAQRVTRYRMPERDFRIAASSPKPRCGGAFHGQLFE